MVAVDARQEAGGKIVLTRQSDTEPRLMLRTEAARIARYEQTRDPALRRTIIEDHLPLARAVTRRFTLEPDNFDDLFQVACVGLVKAVDRFDSRRGATFSTYAVPTIMGELQRHVRDHGWAVHLSRRLKELTVDVQRTLDALQHDLRRTPTVGEIARSLRVHSDAVVDALRAASAHTAQSLDAPAVDGDPEPIVSSLGCEEPGYDLVEQRALLRALAPRLSECERTVLWLRLEQDLTQREIARRVGVSQATIARAQHVVARELSRLSDGIAASSGDAPASPGA